MNMSGLKKKRIAIVHDYLLRMGGAERVLKVFHEMFPQAPIYCVVYDRNFVNRFLGDANVAGSFLQKTPSFLRKKYKYLSFLIPSAVEALDLSGFDIIISSSSAFSKGVITRPDSIHICYCHTPTRFLWDWTHPYSEQLSKKGVLSVFAKITLHALRIWDHQSARRVDHFIANSENVAKRIEKYYKRNSSVIYPPSDCLLENAEFQANDRGGLYASGSDPYYLIVSQLRPYKRIDIAIEAFKKLGYRLVVIGDGTEKFALKRMCKGFKNLNILGYVGDDILREYYANCKALIFPGEEDFGISMVEAMCFGKPVLALRRGGAKEIVVEGVTGEFFDDSHPVLLADGVRRLNENMANYNRAEIMERAKRFSRNRFEEKIYEFIDDVISR